MDTSFTAPTLPHDLDDYLRSNEAMFDDITAGAEKTIHWADPTRKHKTPIAFVYFHGYSATRQESMPVPKQIADQYKSNIFYTRLTGNGRSDDALIEGSVNNWVNDASEALAIGNAIGERTIVIGCSTGATIAWWAAHQPELAKQIKALIFFSPNFGLADPRGELLTIHWGGPIAELIIGNYRENDTVSDEHRAFWTNRYPTKSLLPMMAMVKVIRKIKPEKYTLPVCIFYSPHDDTVSAEKIEEFYEALECKKKIFMIDDPDAASQHVIVGDILAPQNNEKVLKGVIEFLEEIDNQNS